MDALLLHRIESQLDALRHDLKANTPQALQDRLRRAELLLAQSAFYMEPNGQPGSVQWVQQVVAFVMERL